MKNWDKLGQARRKKDKPGQARTSYDKKEKLGQARTSQDRL